MRKMTQQRPKHSISSKRHPKEVVDAAVHSLNASIGRLSQSVLPKHPYLLSVPSDVPYRHSSRFVPTWFNGTPFDKREEQLQYLSFLPHQDENEELLRVLGGWSDDRGSILREDPSPKTAYNSGRNTPLDQSSRKKISLKDYKTKDKMAPDHDLDVSEKNVKSEQSVHAREASNAIGSKLKLSGEARQSDGIPSQNQEPVKREPAPSEPVPHLDGAFSGFPSPPTHHAFEMSPRPSKKRKLSNSPEPKAVQALGKDAAETAMPQLLSPTLPAPEGAAPILPELLSPILPPTLLKAIATPPPQPHSDNGHQHYRSESVRSILANAISESSPRPDNKIAPVSGSLGSLVRSDSAHSARSNVSVGPPTNRTVAALKPGTPNLSPSRSPRPRQRHIIALKYGKKNRRRVEALLKFAARPKKVFRPPELAESASIPEIGPQLSSIKMSREKSTDNAVKPKTTQESSIHLKRPTTPVPSIREPKHSPVPSANITKSIHVTPKKEPRSTAMRRVESVEGGDPSTPGDKGRSSTPLSIERASHPPKSSPGPTSAPHAASEDRQAWLEVHQKYFQLGRAIKHNATDDNEPGSAKYAVLLVEALLSFMVGDTAQTLSKPSGDHWNSILDYLRFVLGGTKKHPHLYGLALQMGAICRHQIQKYELDRLARDPLPEDCMGSAPTPGSDGNTKTTEDSERYKSDYLRNRDRMVRNARDLQTLWLDGSRRLSPEVLRTDYPRTWEARRRDFERRGTDKATPGNIPKDYFLPMDAASLPFEAIRYGLAFLKEWGDVNGVKWKTSIDL